MRRVGWAILFAATSCVIAVILWWRVPIEHAPLDAPAPPIHRPSESEGQVAGFSEGAPEPSRPIPVPQPPPDYAAQLRAASDYLDYVHSLLGAARAGDHAAQFYIFRAFEKCDAEFRLYFGTRLTRVPLDDALKWAANKGWPFDPEEVRRVHGRCFGLLDSGVKEFGDRNEWLRLASDGGYPLAQVFFVRHQAMDARKAGADDPAAREARRLTLAEALRSRDPEVIFEIGSSLFVTLASNDERAWDETEWVLAACFRGLDCSPQSEVARRLCLFDRACQPYESVVDIVRRGNPTEFPAMEEHARSINGKIDEGDWAALGF